MTRFVIFLLAALLFSACGARPVPVGELLSTPAASSDASWTIHFSLNGGFAGLDQSMDISDTGQVTVTDARTGKTTSIQLTPDQMSQLRQMAAKSVFQPTSKPSACADCFVYTLEIDTGSGSPFSAQVDDSNLESSGLASLIEFLRSVMNAALKS